MKIKREKIKDLVKKAQNEANSAYRIKNGLTEIKWVYSDNIEDMSTSQMSVISAKNKSNTEALKWLWLRNKWDGTKWNPELSEAQKKKVPWEIAYANSKKYNGNTPRNV